MHTYFHHTKHTIMCYRITVYYRKIDLWGSPTRGKFVCSERIGFPYRILTLTVVLLKKGFHTNSNAIINSNN